MLKPIFLLALLTISINCLSMGKAHHYEQQFHLMQHLAFKDNLMVQNWYYGSISAIDYRLRIFQSAAKQVTNPCPLATPFVNSDMQTCVQCPIETPLRNLGTFKCEPCPTGQQYNKTIGNCTQAIALNNPQTGKTGSERSNTDNNSPQSASTESPIQSSSAFTPIVVTPQSSTSSTTTATTTTTNTTSSSSTQPAQKSSKPQNNGSSNSDVVDQDSVISMPANEQKNILQNLTSNTAQIDSENKTKYVPASSKVLPINQLIGTKQHNCDQSTPFFNETSQKCQACLKNQQFITASHQCLPVIYNYNKNAKNLIMPTQNYQKSYDSSLKSNHPNRTIHECDADKPYIQTNGTGSHQTYTCVNCPDNQYFLVMTQQCINGCPLGTIYSSKKQICQNGIYVMNPNATHLLFNYDSQYNKWFQNNQKVKNGSQNAIYCPIEKPYLKDGECINCSTGNNILFDVSKSQCTQCGKGRQYNSEKKICIVSGLSNGVNLGRVIANIF